MMLNFLIFILPWLHSAVIQCTLYVMFREDSKHKQFAETNGRFWTFLS